MDYQAVVVVLIALAAGGWLLRRWIIGAGKAEQGGCGCNCEGCGSSGKKDTHID